MSKPAKARDYVEEARSLLQLACSDFEAIEQEDYLDRQERGRSTERSIVAANYAERLRENLEGVLSSLAMGRADSALLRLADMASNLPTILRDAVEGMVSSGDRKRGSDSQRQASASRLKIVEAQINALRTRNPRAYRSAAACLRKIHAEASGASEDSALRKRIFPGKLTDLESFERWYRRARRAAAEKKGGHP